MALFISALVLYTTLAAAISASGRPRSILNTKDFWKGADGYVILAQNLIETGRFAFAPDANPTVYRGPAFPVALATAYLLTHTWLSAVLLVNMVASAISILLAYALMCRFYRPRTAFWIALAALGYLPAIHYTLSSWSDTFLTMAFLLYIWLTLCAFEKAKAKTVAISGLAFALLLMTKPVFAAIPFVSVVVGLVSRRQWLLPLLGQLAVATIALAPWTARNYQLVHRPTLVALGGGFNLLVGNFMIDHQGDCNSSFKAATRDAFRYVQLHGGTSVSTSNVQSNGFYNVPPSLDQVFLLAALEHIRHEPSRFFRKLLVNIPRFWYFASTPRRCVQLMVMNTLILILAGVELWRQRRRAPEAVAWIVCVSMCVWFTYSLIIVHSRFYLPLMAILCPLALGRLTSFLRPSDEACYPNESDGGASSLVPGGPNRAD